MSTLPPAMRLYTDLLIKCISNAVYADDAAMQEARYKNRAAALTEQDREIGLDWPSKAHSMVGLTRLANLRDLTQRVIDENIPGDLIETGVWRGGCCILMRGVLAANDDRSRKVFAADSFEGLPPANVDAYPADAKLGFLAGIEELAVPLDEVKRNFAAYGLLDEQVVFVKGLFSQTLRSLPTKQLALLRLDGDLYESTMDALEALYPKLSPGGFVIADDYFLPACRQAVHDYLERIGETATMERIDWSAVWWRKAGRVA